MTQHPSAEGAQEKGPPLWHAGAIECWARGDNGVRGQELRAAAAELRRLHARVQELERAVADEREACARMAEQAHPHDWAFIGAAIRARGAQGESNG